MADSKNKLGEYRTRMLLLKRESASQGDNGEEVESWPDPPSDPKSYWCKRENLTGGEDITQGLRQTTGAMKLRIRGGVLPIEATDRMKNSATGEVWAVTGISREDAETVVSCERVHQQTVAQ